MADYCGGLEQCEKIFLRIATYWRSALIGFVGLLGLATGVWAWTWKQMETRDAALEHRMQYIEASLNDISYLRSQSNEILENQRLILKYFEKKR